MFVILILLVFSGTFCRIESWKVILNRPVLRERNPPLTSNSSRSYVESPSKNSRNSDSCCVKKTFYKNGRVQFICKSEHPDCFAKSDASSSSFGLCVSVVDSKNNVMGCRCAVQTKPFSFERLSIVIHSNSIVIAQRGDFLSQVVKIVQVFDIA